MIVRLGSSRGPRVLSPSESIDHFAKQTRGRQTQWAERLSHSLDAFADIEHEIDEHYRQGAGQLMAALLGKVMLQPVMAEKVEETRQASAVALRASQPRSLQLRLLCGLVLFVSTAYCAPRRNKRNNAQPHEQQAGLYPELAALGFFKGCSPALQSTVARIVALSPSIAVAHKELAREGISWTRRPSVGLPNSWAHRCWRSGSGNCWRGGRASFPPGRTFAGGVWSCNSTADVFAFGKTSPVGGVKGNAASLLLPGENRKC
jgi:hypothetical protein